MAGRKDPLGDQKTEILDWVEAMVGEKIPRDQPFEKVLKDGVILCNMINKLVPGSVKRINKKGGNFALMENVAAFQKALKAYGLPDDEIFQTVDLFEARNIKQVVKSLQALGRLCLNNGYDGPVMGGAVKMSDKNERTFTEEQMRASEGQVSLQYGSNKGASQAGVNMGKQRMILD